MSFTIPGVKVIVDWHVSVGTLIEVVMILGGGLLFLWGMKTRVDFLSLELTALKSEISKLSDILTKLAVQDQRILNVETDVKDLRHGHGFVVRPPPAAQG